MTGTRTALSDPQVSAMRWAAPFTSYVIATVDTLGYLCGISMKELYLHPEACITAFTEGKAKLWDLMGDEVQVIIPYTTPVIKYGHINSLGVPLLFPDIGQVALDLRSKDMRELTKFLHSARSMDFLSSETTRFQVSYLKTLRKAFPGQRVHWGWQWEGPLTTIWALSGTQSMYAVIDEPEAFHQCMHLVTESIVSYTQFYCGIDGTTVLDPFPDHGRLCDDIAAMFSPAMWPEVVLPYWKQFLTAPVPERKLHCEDMKSTHLPFLDSLELTDFDPGISAHLNPGIIRAGTHTPFCWRLGSFHYRDMTKAMVHDLVLAAAADRAGYVFTVMEPIMCDTETVEKVRLLHRTGLMVRQMILDGASLDSLRDAFLGDYPEGFWQAWNGYRASPSGP